jgi:glucokinase
MKSVRYAACFDIGGTKVLLGLVDQSGKVAARERYLLGSDRQPEGICTEVIGRLRHLANQNAVPWQDITGIGCSAAVQGDIEQGMVFSAPNIFGARFDIPLREILERIAGLPAFLEMDAYASALGESWLGVGAGIDYLVHIIIGTGIGAGILKNGTVFRGWRGTAGEFGHMTIVPDGPYCNCGRFGCLEALASGPAIALQAEGAVAQNRPTMITSLATPGSITAEHIFQASRQGDTVANEIISQTVRFLAIGISNLIHLLNPRVISLGGGIITNNLDLLLAPLRLEISHRCGYWVDLENTQILPGKLGDDSALLGVAHKVFKNS